MRYLLFLILGAAPAAGGDAGVANVAALVVAGGTAIAGLVAWVRLRQDRPKVVAEVASLAETRLRDELATAWRAVDRLRDREVELEAKVAECQAENRRQAERITELERRLGNP